MSETGDDDRVRIFTREVLSKGWATLTRYVFDLRRRDGSWQRLTREVQDHGNAVAVLPVDRDRGTVLLVRQFRLPAHLNGHDGMLIEACAGIIDPGESAEAAVVREAEEELGYRVHDVEPLFDAFVGPGSVTERMVYCTARYTPADRVSSGGGAAHEGEDIEVIEMPLDEAFSKVAGGEIADTKTILLIQHLRQVVDAK
jgi:nudix-type nucleoside diphosphatase (YffH/AdpP family)